MDPWEHVSRAAADHRSGSVEIAVRAARGLRALSTKQELTRAARTLLRAHPTMAAVWRLCAEALNGREPGPAVDAFIEGLRAGSDAAADATRWVITRRGSIVVTHSSSGTVLEALRRSRARIRLVRCTTSMPGGEGRSLARRLAREGIDAEVIPDAAMVRACSSADVAIVGADAVTDVSVVNKVGTHLLALASREAGVPVYAIAPRAKMVPDHVIGEHERYDRTPLGAFDSIVTDAGAMGSGAIKRLARAVTIPRRLEAMQR